MPLPPGKNTEAWVPFLETWVCSFYVRCSLSSGVPRAPHSDSNEAQIGEAFWRCRYMLLPKDGSNSEVLRKKKLCVCACVCKHACTYVCMYSKRPEEGTRLPRAGIAGTVSCPIWLLGTELGASAKAASSLLSHLSSPNSKAFSHRSVMQHLWRLC